MITTCNEFSFFEFRITNRWGETIFLTNDYTKGWNGTYKDQEQEVGVYIYSIRYIKEGKTNEELLNGNVTLIR